MEKKRAGRIALGIILAVVLAVISVGGGACGCSPDLSDAPEFERKIIADFTKGEQAEVFTATDGYGNGDVFNVEWDTSMVTYADGAAKLSIAEKPEGEGNDPTYTHYGAELRSSNMYHYGFYSVSMKPSKVTGTCSAFFTYTGPYDYDEEGNPHPWDEIDIEFLGKNTTMVQFNYFVNGVGGHEYEYELGFDASEEYHEYGFYWEEDRITWYVDGKPVYRVEESAKNPLPSTPGRIMMNHWYGNARAEAWMGKYTADSSSTYYKTVSCTAEGKTPNPAPQPPETEGDYELSETDNVALGFVNAGSAYTITDTSEGAKTSYNVTYSDIAGQNWGENLVVSGSDIVRFSNNNNTFGLTVKNNGTEAVNVRVDVMDTSIEVSGGNNDGKPKHQCINDSAYQDNIAVTTDKEWGGSKFAIEAGETSRLIVIYDGNPDKISVFLDSHMPKVNGSPVVYSGDVDISEFNFCVATGEGIPEPAAPVEVPEVPETPTEQELLIGGMYAWGGYTLAKAEDNKSVEVTYGTETPGIDQWAAVAQDFNSDIFGENDIFSVKVENKGTAPVVFRINIENETNNSNFVKSASYTDETDAVIDASGGGGYMGNITLEAGKTITVKVVFEKDASITRFSLNFDSHTDNYATASGDILLSEFKLSADPMPQITGDQSAPADSDGISLSGVYTWGGYNSPLFSENGTSFRITYRGLDMYAGFGNDIASETVGSNNTLTLKIRNDSESGTAKVKIDVGTKTDGALTNKVTSGSYNDGTADHDITVSGGFMTPIEIAAGQTVTLKVVFTNAGDITGYNIAADSFDSTCASAVGNLVFSDFNFSMTA